MRVWCRLNIGSLARSAQYKNIIHDQYKAGIFERVENKFKEGTHYLPHNPVVRNDAETKRSQRMDVSVKSRKGKLSLNNCLYTGPSLAPMLYDTLL